MSAQRAVAGGEGGARRKDLAAERRREAEVMEDVIAQYLHDRDLRIEEFEKVVVPSDILFS